jgi:hypothetical protein
MAYLTCPWCLTPQLIADDAAEYQCFTCYGEIRFFKCPECDTVQTVNKRWRSFTCGHCDRKIDLPPRWGYAKSATAMRVTDTGQPYPKL